MPSFRQSLLPVTCVLLSILIVLLGMKAARDEAPEMQDGIRAFKSASHLAQSASLHKIAGFKDIHRPCVPLHNKHHRSRAHHVPVAKIAVTPAYAFSVSASVYNQKKPLPLARVYRYAFYMEITPPPPKEC